MLGYSIIRNVGTEHIDVMVECFSGIRTEQMQRILENRDLGSPDAVVNTVCCTNDIRRTVNVDCVMGDVHDVVNKAD